MSDSVSVLAEIHTLIVGNGKTRPLNPSAFESKMAEWLRGGIAGGSSSERVSGTRQDRGPGLDKTDLQVRNKRKLYRQALENALRELVEASRLETWIIPSDEVKQDATCTNLDCDDGSVPGKKTPMRITDEGRLLCARCRQHKSRYGLSWPKKPAETKGVNPLRV